MAKYIGFVGTYTKGLSEGVYTFTLDSEAGTLSDVKVAARLDNPTYLAISEDQQYLYAVVKEGEKGGVASFSLNDKTGELTMLNEQVEAGSPPCHVSLDRENSYVLTANYHKGSIGAYPVINGLVQQVGSSIKHEGSGPDHRQEKAHAHYASFTPDGKYIAAIDLGTDLLVTYGLIEGQLTEVSRLLLRPGSGPRHLEFDPNGQFAYLMTEFSSEVIVLKFDQEMGTFKEIQYISTIPASFTDNNQGSAIHLSPDGKFVYAGNRGHNSIAVFGIEQESGMLNHIENVSTRGSWPRDFELDPSDKFIVVSNQESNNLVLFSRDSSSGKLVFMDRIVTIPEPVCVKFIR